MVGYGGGRRYELGGLVIEPGQTRQDGWSALTLTAIEGDLATAPSRCWLITATGYVENTDMGWKDAEHTSVGNIWGKAPTLVEGIPARLTVPFAAEQVEVWRWTSAANDGSPCRAGRPRAANAVIAIRPGVEDTVVRGRGSRSSVWQGEMAGRTDNRQKNGEQKNGRSNEKTLPLYVSDYFLSPRFPFPRKRLAIIASGPTQMKARLRAIPSIQQPQAARACRRGGLGQ